MQPDTYAAGVRRRYQDLPLEVHAWVEAQLGGAVTEVANMAGGFSPGVAAAVTTDSGQSRFVKAVGSATNPDSLRFYQQERDVTGRIPLVPGILRPVGSTDLEVDGETYAVLLFPTLNGATPRHPWQQADLTLALDALELVSARLTPSPWPATPADQHLLQFFTWWARIAADPMDPWHDISWIANRMPALGAAEDQLRAELGGQTLSHTDLRADNIMMTPERVWFVDWAHAQNAARWVDAALLLADVITSRADLADGGEIDIRAEIGSHSLLTEATFQPVWRLMAGLAGAMHGMSRQPSPPGLPTIRSWQASTADTLIGWCQRESPPDGDL